jgi:YbgC/YbaW family acyl-CoA thioester hydrolase
MKKNRVKRQITWGDLDSLGIVFYPRYYEWIDASGHLFFQSINVNLGNLLKENSIIFALLETGCTYYSPGRYQDRIEITSYIEDLSDKIVLLRHNIIKLKDSELMVEGFEKRICLHVSNPSKFKAITIPKGIRDILINAQFDM